MIVLAVCLLIFVVAVGLLAYVRWEHGTLEKMCIPVVKHHPILGSTREIYNTPGGLNDIKWMKKYGPIFGVYEGRQPQVFVCVPDLVRLICVKDAEYFNSKRRLEYGDPLLNEMPDFQELEKWKLLRAMATPSFTSAKIKLMNLPMTDTTKDFVVELMEKIKNSEKGVLENFPLDMAIHSMLTDLILRCVFSIQIKSTTGENNEFAELVRDLTSPATTYQIPELVIWSHSFPFLKMFLPSIFKAEPVAKFIQLFRQIISERRRSGKKHNDMVDMCVEWCDKLDTPEYKKAKVNELSIYCLAFAFFLALPDQASTMVSAVIYHMLRDPKIARKIYDEVDTVFAKHNGNVEHEHLPELVYLNACLNEALRLYGFFHRTERVCTKDWSNEEYGLHIKKGMTIQIPIWAINRENNVDGYEYKPERFMPDNEEKLDPYSSTAFGFGPRNCTGKMFAVELMPIILAYLLKDFKFLGRNNTSLEFIPGGPFFQPHNPIYVDVMQRSD